MKWCLIAVLMMVAGAAHAQTDVWPDPVVKQEATPLPLWLPRFSGAGALQSKAQRLEQIVLQDLEFTGCSAFSATNRNRRA